MALQSWADIERGSSVHPRLSGAGPPAYQLFLVSFLWQSSLTLRLLNSPSCKPGDCETLLLCAKPQIHGEGPASMNSSCSANLMRSATQCPQAVAPGLSPGPSLSFSAVTFNVDLTPSCRSCVKIRIMGMKHQPTPGAYQVLWE